MLALDRVRVRVRFIPSNSTLDSGGVEHYFFLSFFPAAARVDDAGWDF